MPRSEAEQALQALGDKLDALTLRINQHDDRNRGIGDVWGWIVGAVGILSLIVSYLRGVHT